MIHFMRAGITTEDNRTNITINTNAMTQRVFAFEPPAGGNG
jgi:hypothetical protein